MSIKLLDKRFTIFESPPPIALFALATLLALAIAFLPLLAVIAAAIALPILYAIGRQWFNRPWTIWLYIAILLPILSAVKLGPASGTDLLVLIAVGLWLFAGIRQNKLHVEISFPAILFSLYASGLLLAFFKATDSVEAFGEVVKWIQVWLVLLLARTMIPKERVPWLVGALLLGGVIQGAIGLSQFLFRIGPSWFLVLGRYMRASGTFSQPNPYAGYLGLCLPVALSLLAWMLLRRNRSTRITLYVACATLIIGFGIIASWSRGAWIGVIMAISAMLCLYDRRSIYAGGALVSIMLLLVMTGSTNINVLPQPVVDRFNDVPALIEKSTKGVEQILNEPLTDNNFAAIERAAHWSAAIKMWEQEPWLGVGPGNYAAVYPDIIRTEKRLKRWADPLGHAHNVYLNVMAEGGIVGILLYFSLWASLFVWVWRQMNRRTGFHRALAIGVIGVMAHLHTHNFFDNLFVQGMYLHIALWLVVMLYEPEPAHTGN